ncbi:MAG: Rne/Rng family ribonuclease [Verrucomicrobia bacterium]|nr:Rne/Rng family ribonuclease [Verrucomicrobiota bacterium]
MSERSFRKGRRGGMHFRPSGKQQKQAERAAIEARAEATGDKTSLVDGVYDNPRHSKEIERAENIAAGLPPDTAPPTPGTEPEGKPNREFRQPHLDTPAEVQEENGSFEPVRIEAPPKGLIGAIKSAATKVIKRVQKLLKPVKKIHKDIIINAEALETRVAVIEEGKLEEFTIERTEEERLVGSIYKGRVRNLEDGLKAAFVDIGFEKNAFLHYWDIVPSGFDSGVEPVEREGARRREKPKVTQRDIPRLYSPGSDIIVQVTKGPIGTKGPRVTTNLVLPGRYLVLLPNSDQSGISRKIESHEERQRLKKILRELTIPEGMGVIMRTAGEGRQARFFVRDVALLLEEWNSIQERIKSQPSATCAFQEPDLIERTVRDFLTEDVERIVVDNPAACERMKRMVEKISPRSAKKVMLYSEPQPIFDRFNITRQLETTFTRQVYLKSGGYIVIDETEALVAIDVNTGRHKTGGRDQETTILRVNLEAADEICRQLRLRNMGGLIVLDFIDMKGRKDQQQVYQRMKEMLRRDRAKTHILPISQLGLMEMTRQRHTESLRSAVYDDCPYCTGKGRVKSCLTMSVEIQRKLGEILKKRQRDESDFQLKIVVHPTVLERLRTEDEKLITEMEKKYFGKLLFRADPALHAEQFKIYNVATDEELASVNG